MNRRISVRVDVYRDKNGEYRWRMKRGGRIVADGGEGYARPVGARSAVKKLVKAIRTAGQFVEIREQRAGGALTRVEEI